MHRAALIVALTLLCFTGETSKAQERAWLAGEQTALEELVEERLGQRASLDFEQVSLDALLSYLAETTELDIVLDYKALTDAGIGADTPVTIQVNNTTYKSALQLVLEPLDLTWVLHAGVVFVTSKTECENLLEAKIYDVSDLVDEGQAGQINLQSLIELITSCIAQTTWDEVGGPGAIKEYRLPRLQTLVISQTREVHQEIASLLSDLRKLGRHAPWRDAISRSASTKLRPHRRRSDAGSSRVYAVAPAWSFPQTHE
ncbi:MAG TPA: hypothetical protein VG125_25505 [Pirellulales bacterium]|jgi:hypothetical protein|nr:hypothetical protein [Pirellulales bacterium]